MHRSLIGGPGPPERPEQTFEASRPKVLTIRQFYDATHGVIGLNSLYELARSGRLKSVRIGRKLLILASEVDDFFVREAGSAS